MNRVWPCPERLLPPKLLSALAAAHSGDTVEAAANLRDAGAEDVLTAEVGRLVRGLIALEQGSTAQARRLLRPLAKHPDTSVSLSATLGLVDLNIKARRYSTAMPLVQRTLNHTHDDAARLVLETTILRLELMRKGHLDMNQIEKLPQLLKRRHPAAVHATVHLLLGDVALTLGRFEDAVKAAQESLPYINLSQQARLRRQHASLSQMLHELHFAEIEDWLRPRRPVSRGQAAALESEPWQVWIDSLHLKLSLRRNHGVAPIVVHFGSALQLWNALSLLVHSPRHRLSWKQVQQHLHLDSEQAASRLFGKLQRHLEEHDAHSIIELKNTNCALADLRFVILELASGLPEIQRLLLGVLAESTSSRALELQNRLNIPKRTLVRHLGILRQNGFVRLVGGGRDACYQLV